MYPVTRNYEVTVEEFESAVLRLEEVVIRIRAPIHTVVEPYDYIRKAGGTSSITEWLHTRILPKIGDLSVSVLDGFVREAHGRTRLSTLRGTYER